jgi:thiamine pyrophosphate-dependent acetolactate synthase large subunit-like protein
LNVHLDQYDGPLDLLLDLIRRQQIVDHGYESGVEIMNPSFDALSKAIGCSYFPASGDLAEIARQVLAARGVRLVELRLADLPSLEWQRLRAVLREGARARVPDGAMHFIRRLLGR